MSRAVRIDPPLTDLAPRAAAVRGAVAAGAAALLTTAAAVRFPPGLLVNVLGPPPLGAWLSASSIVIAPLAGALVGRRAARTHGTPSGRTARTSLSTALAYLATVMLPVILLRIAEGGALAFAYPFAIIVNGLSVCVVVVPWAALPILGATLAIERWTRPRARRVAAIRSPA